MHSHVVDVLLRSASTADLHTFQTLAKGIDLPGVRDARDNTLLHLAAKSGNVSVLGYLITTMPHNINAINLDDETALHAAARTGNSEPIMLLLDSGADARIASRFGETAADLCMCRDERYWTAFSILHQHAQKTIDRTR